MDIKKWLAAARGDEPADISLRGGRVVNVATGETLETDVAFAEGRIAGVGSGLDAREIISLDGAYVAPGLVDAHVHMESSMSTPAEFARAVVPRGTTTVVADPHEIANVAGAEGVRYMLAASAGLPLSVQIMLPSCVPATPLGTAGAELNAKDLAALSSAAGVSGLAEFMNVPGAVGGDAECLNKLAVFEGRAIDGHAPGATGRTLQAYTGLGPRTDHESMTPDEAREKLRAGMYVLLREGTAARNLLELLPAVTPENSRRCAFCTDDRQPASLLDQGHIDHLVRLAVQAGLPWMTALQMATLNPCECFGLRDRGLLAPGRRADVVVFRDPTNFRAEMVFSGGRCFGFHGSAAGDWPLASADDRKVRGSMRVPWDRVSLKIPAMSDARVRVIDRIPRQLVTHEVVLPARVEKGEALADASRDLAKLAVIERHHGSGRAGLGFVRGLGLRHGALACSIAHDAHNLVVAGMDDASMLAAARTVADAGGGLAAADGSHVLAQLPLPVGGLMSDRPMVETRRAMDQLVAAATALGAPEDPWMSLSFLSLEVIPDLKLTDRGLVDVRRFQFVPVVLG